MIVVFVILCFGCMMLFQNRTVRSILSDMVSQNTTNVQYTNYSIKEEQIYFQDVHIRYPIFVLDGSQFEEDINHWLFDRLLGGWSKEDIESYEGVQYYDNDYDISFANEDIVSILTHIYIAEGGRTFENWRAITFSISEQKILCLSDFCTWEDMVQSVDTPEDLLKRDSEIWKGQYDADELRSEICWESEYNFYLGPDFVDVILKNRALSSQDNWTLKVPVDWTSKE